MDTRRLLSQVVAISLAAYGVIVLVHAAQTVYEIMFQSNYYSTGGGHAIMLATTIAVGIGVLCLIPSIFLLIGIIARKRHLKHVTGPGQTFFYRTVTPAVGDVVPQQTFPRNRFKETAIADRFL